MAGVAACGGKAGAVACGTGVGWAACPPPPCCMWENLPTTVVIQGYTPGSFFITCADPFTGCSGLPGHPQLWDGAFQLDTGISAGECGYGICLLNTFGCQFGDGQCLVAGGIGVGIQVFTDSGEEHYSLWFNSGPPTICANPYDSLTKQPPPPFDTLYKNRWCIQILQSGNDIFGNQNITWAGVGGSDPTNPLGTYTQVGGCDTLNPTLVIG